MDNEQLNGCSCIIVFIGANTAVRKWITYEIEKSWNDGKGLLGIYIHNLKDKEGNQSTKGRNPFDDFTMKRDNSKLSIVVKAYDPSCFDSQMVYDYIKKNLASWVEEAIKIRNNLLRSHMEENKNPILIHKLFKHI